MGSAGMGSDVSEDEMRPGFRVTIGADRGEIAKVNAAVAAFADAHALSATVRRSIQVALDEMVSNAIMHGLAGQKGGEVTVEAELLTDRVRLTVTDDGRPFDPLDVAAPDTTLTTQERRIGGLGIHLVRHVMDEVSYRRQADRNVVILEKRLTPD